MEASMGVTTLNGPVDMHWLQRFSAKDTDTVEALAAARRLTESLVRVLVETLFPAYKSAVVTRMGAMTRERVPNLSHPLVVVGVARAGLPLAQCATDFLRELGYCVRHDVVSAERQTGEDGKVSGVRFNGEKVPNNRLSLMTPVIVVDPMCATGVTGAAIARHYRELMQPERRLVFLHLIATEQGMQAVRKEYSDARFIVGRVDPQLTPEGYILPGAGDVGELFFGR